MTIAVMHICNTIVRHHQQTLSSFVPHDKQPVSVALHPPDTWPSDAPPPTFSAPTFHQHLGTAVLGHTLLTAAQLHSTQTLLQDNRALLPDGVVCVADVQTTGKGAPRRAHLLRLHVQTGRGGNVWTSPPGCLMFSLTKQLDVGGARLPFVQYVACMAVVEAVQSLAPDEEVHEARSLQARMHTHASQAPLLRVKWPNDLYSQDGLKVGGILCHSAYRDDRFSATVGIGLNVTNDQPTTCVQALLRQRLGNASVSREALLAGIVLAMEVHLDTLQREGFQPLQERYLRYWLHTGQVVQVEGGGEVTVRGLSGGGFLLAEDATGEAVELHPDGNRCAGFVLYAA